MNEGLYYIVIEGTNKREMTMVNADTRIPNITRIPNMYDTQELAQTTIDKSVEYRKQVKLDPVEKSVPISVAEYNRKYVTEV